MGCKISISTHCFVLSLLCLTSVHRSVNRDTATITVVFRGQESVLDLVRDSSMSRYSNPLLHEDYEGNSPFIKLRAAVSDEIMRVRRDNKKSTVDEIRDKVEKIGQELKRTNRDGYHLSVTGHNLGGGLATVVGFCLAADPTLELASAVRIFTFASSRVGCQAFQQSFRHLEKTGRLQHARFTTSNEIISLLPLGKTYRHVGLCICLHKSNAFGRWRMRRCLDVNYSSNAGRGRLGELALFLRNCLLAETSSRISEYQHRMHLTREYRLALGEGGRFQQRKISFVVELPRRVHTFSLSISSFLASPAFRQQKKSLKIPERLLLNEVSA